MVRKCNRCLCLNPRKALAASLIAIVAIALTCAMPNEASAHGARGGIFQGRFGGVRVNVGRSFGGYSGASFARSFANPCYNPPVQVIRAPCYVPPVQQIPVYYSQPVQYVQQAPVYVPPVQYVQPVQQAPVYQAPAYQAPVCASGVCASAQQYVQQSPVYQAPVLQAPVYSSGCASLFLRNVAY